MSPNMKGLSVTGIVLLFYACHTDGVPISYDCTEPLNAIRAGNLSVHEFSKNIKSHFANLATPLKLSVAYSPDCNIVVECGSTMKAAVQILHDVKANLLKQNVEIEHLSFRFRIDVSALESLNQSSINQTKLNIPAGTHDISFLLPDNTTCVDLRNVPFENWPILLNYSTWITPESLPNIHNLGFGYNEDLIGCFRSVYHAKQKTKYLLTTFSLGKTSCVVESFGIFKKRMNDIHARNIEFTKYVIQDDYQVPFIDYSSTSHCSGDEYYGHLQERYWERYTNTKIGATIAMPIGRFEIPSYSTNKIIPYIDAKSCSGRDSYPWYAPTALEALSRYFGTVVLTHIEGKTLQSYATSSATNGNPDSGLEFFIDYTDWLQYNPENINFSRLDYNWSQVERDLKELGETILHPLKNVKVTTLIFPIKTSPTAESYSVNVNTGFARRMSSQLEIGCAFGPLFNSTPSSVVAACKEVNGSIYTLQYHFKLESIINRTKENHQHFENVVRPKLEEIKKFRKEILVLHLTATVYFQLRFELQMNDKQKTVFCNGETLSLNEYIEATVNWATLNRISLIMGRAFDDSCQSKYQTWFSVFRPTKKHTYPQFFIRNSPQILSNSEIEPCLAWTEQKPIVTESYFYNNYLGSRFDTSHLRKDKQVTREEYKILLQFTFHRFDLVMLYVSSDTYKDIVVAINTLASEGLIGPTKKFFVFYFDEREIAVEEKLQDFNGFLNFTKVTLGTNVLFLKAIFCNWAEFVVKSDWNNFNLKIHHNTMGIEWGRNFSLDVGVSLHTKVCQNIIANATSRKHISKEADNLLFTSKYLLCGKTVDLKKGGNLKNLGMLFDTHFYIKKVYQEFYPQLDLYFEIFVEVVLTEKTMTEYLILLSHFQKFAATYNLSYVIVYAFDFNSDTPNGWWKISNYSDLSLTSIYEEKYSASVGSKTWRPTPQTNTPEDNKQNIIFGATTSGLVITIVVLGLVLWYYKNKKPQYLSNEEEKEFYNGKEGTVEEEASGDSEYRIFDKKFELALADLVIDPKDLLGRGNFGTVYKGLVKEEPVAIKRPNDNCPTSSFKSVLCEIKVLCYIGTHPNVVQFIGAYTKEIKRGILYIATEFCSNGSLDGLLRKKKRVVLNMGDVNNDTIGAEDEDALYSHDLQRFAKEIASGMEYIAGKNVIHGDLAARNVLLDENFTCKIGDFGLSRKLYAYLEYVKQSQEPLPWKWMAYESLKNMQFTSKSDVWSYGVTLWEIYSLGSVPYGGLSWTTGFVDDLKNGLRLQIPEHATEEVYKTMSSCWELEADDRPTFTDIVDVFKQLTSSEYIVLNI